MGRMAHDQVDGHPAGDEGERATQDDTQVVEGNAAIPKNVFGNYARSDMLVCFSRTHRSGEAYSSGSAGWTRTPASPLFWLDGDGRESVCEGDVVILARSIDRRRRAPSTTISRYSERLV